MSIGYSHGLIVVNLEMWIIILKCRPLQFVVDEYKLKSKSTAKTKIRFTTIDDTEKAGVYGVYIRHHDTVSKTISFSVEDTVYLRNWRTKKGPLRVR